MIQTKKNSNALTISTIDPMVAQSLQEDIGTGDITAQLLDHHRAIAQIKTREPVIICGQLWVDRVFYQLDSTIVVNWHVSEGDWVQPDQIIATVIGDVRALLSGERTALNWLQTLSGTATTVYHYVNALKDSATQLLDTRKTIPGLRLAQKYAVTIAGGHNHRLGLYDAFLIKENHISSCGSITEAIRRARLSAADKKVEVEIERLAQLQEALDAKADIIMLDNFNVSDIEHAVKQNKKQAKLEVSGNISLETIRTVAKTGVDYISIGAITKHINAIDLTMRIS